MTRDIPRCERHPLFCEELTLPTAMIELSPCSICGRPAQSIYRADSAAFRRSGVKARQQEFKRERIEELSSTLKMRECICYDPCGDFILRYDFSYVDPASGRWRQYGTTSFWTYEPKGEELEHARDFNKRMVAREIYKQCGTAVIPKEMFLPTHVKARMV